MSANISLTLEVLKNVQKQWVDMAHKHEALAKTCLTPLTRQAHEREERYYQGKADGVRQAVETLEDAILAESERIASRAFIIASDELSRLREALGRDANEEESEGIWEASRAHAMSTKEVFARYEGMTQAEVMAETAVRVTEQAKR
jgi:hypothetical protein